MNMKRKYFDAYTSSLTRILVVYDVEMHERSEII